MARESIRRRLLGRLLAPLLVIGLVSGGATYWLAWIPARDAYDLALANAAWDLASQLPAARRSLPARLSRDFHRSLPSDRYDHLYVAVHDRNGILLAGEPGLPVRPVPHDLDRPVFYDGAYQRVPVRLATVTTLVEGERVLVTVAETTTKRQSGQRKILATQLLWVTALIVTISGVAWISVGEGLAPLRRLRGDIAQRSLQDLTPLDESRAPVEVQPLVVALNALLARIAEAAHDQQAFLADIAHQLRTPLAGLVTQLAAMRQRLGNETFSSSIELIQSTADRTVRLANQLLSLARAESSGFHPERLQPLAVDEVIRQNVDAWVWLADQKRIELHFALHPARILGDAFLLHELLDNLLTNAIQYTPAGGRVEIGCRTGAHAVVVFVEDTGPGITPEDRERVFEKFYRAANTPGPGSGLGLAIVHEIAKDHRGKVCIAAPEHGRGTRVEVRFPALASA